MSPASSIQLFRMAPHISRYYIAKPDSSIAITPSSLPTALKTDGRTDRGLCVCVLAGGTREGEWSAVGRISCLLSPVPATRSLDSVRGAHHLLRRKLPTQSRGASDASLWGVQHQALLQSAPAAA